MRCEIQMPQQNKIFKQHGNHQTTTPAQTVHIQPALPVKI